MLFGLKHWWFFIWKRMRKLSVVRQIFFLMGFTIQTPVGLAEKSLFVGLIWSCFPGLLFPQKRHLAKNGALLRSGISNLMGSTISNLYTAHTQAIMEISQAVSVV